MLRNPLRALRLTWPTLPRIFAIEEFCICTSWHLDVPHERITFVVTDPMSILQWWAPVFLRGEVLGNQNAPQDGFRARFQTKGFLPHTFQFIAEIKRQDAHHLTITTSGDFDGVGTIDVTPQGAQTKVDVEWRVRVDHPYMQPFLKLLKPVFVWNHKWAMRQGQQGLESFVLQGAGSLKGPTFPHNLPVMRSPMSWRL